MLSLLVATSCDDFLTELPSTAIPEEEAMKSLQAAEEVVIGTYSCFKNPALYSGNMIQASEIQADVLYAAIGYTNKYGEFYRWEANANNSTFLSVYAGLYQIVSRCNFFFDHLEEVRSRLTNKQDLATLDKYEADIRFMRALAYADLIRYFCPAYEEATAETTLGVPLYLHYREGDGSTVIKPRASLQASYDLVMSDLKRAEELVTRAGSDGMYITEGAVWALHARCYMYMAQWEKAEEYATKVIESDFYRLADAFTSVQAGSSILSEYNAMWVYDTSEEIIWKISFSTTDRGGALGQMFMGYLNGVYSPDYMPAKWLVDSYTNADARYSAFFTRTVNMQGYEWEVVTKYPGNPEIDGNAGLLYTNMPKVFRLSEMYLIRAEAHAMMGNTGKANDDLTTLRRARIKNYGVSSHPEDKLLEAIQEERAKELLLEGFRLADLKRWKKGFEREPQTGTLTGPLYSSLKIEGDNKRFTWFIPQHEITASGGAVIQNEY